MWVRWLSQREVKTMNRYILPAAALALLQGCVTATVDEMVFNEPIEGIGDSSVVILGRRHAPDYETEPDFIECVGDHISARDKSITLKESAAFLKSFEHGLEGYTYLGS